MKKLQFVLPAIVSLLTLSVVNQVKAQPIVNQLPNGNYNVVTGDCTAIFNSSGTLLEGGQNCDDIELFDTKKAMASYLAEQSGSGSEHQSTTHTPQKLFGTVPPNLQDLVDAKAGQAEGQLVQRGYTYHNTVTFEGGKSSYYIENATGYCVEVGTVEGRYSSIVYNASRKCAKTSP